MKKFEGIYIKCNGYPDAVAVIFGRSFCGKESNSFVQVITEQNSYFVEFDIESSVFKRRKHHFNVRIGENHVNTQGMSLNIRQPNFTITGEIQFGRFYEIKSDAMGFFRFFPFMECRHFITSMYHEISGQISINEKVYSFDQGFGYIEGDCGQSFPKKYFWSQCAFPENGTFVSVSCARIPYLKFRFTGTICLIHHKGKEIRLATYLGARIKQFNRQKLMVVQGFGRKRSCLEIEIFDDGNHNDFPLMAPHNGKMSRYIKESLARTVRYKLTAGKRKNEEVIFDLTGDRAALEFSEY